MPSLPSLVIIDSVQTLRTAACSNGMGSVTQIRESTSRFVELAKTSGNTHRYVRTCVNAYMHLYIQTNIHAYTQTHIHTYECTHPLLLSHISTHTCTCTCTYDYNLILDVFLNFRNNRVLTPQQQCV